MKLTHLITFNALLAAAAGVAFTLYAPIMLALFTVPEVLEGSVLDYWSLASFARLFGAALFGFGLLLWSLRGLVEDAPTNARRGVIFALLLAHLMGAFVSITQQAQIWDGLAGWITSGVYVLLMLGYGYFLVKESSSS